MLYSFCGGLGSAEKHAVHRFRRNSRPMARAEEEIPKRKDHQQLAGDDDRNLNNELGSADGFLDLHGQPGGH